MRRVVFGIAIASALVAAAADASAQGTAADARLRLRQQQITTMERVLEGAVQNGVNSLRDRVRAIMPGDVLLQDTRPEVRGFPLDGFGVFFDVEVPALRQSLAWTIQQMNQSGLLLARDLQQLRQFMDAMPDPGARAQFERIVQNIQRQVGPVPPVVAERQPAAAAAGQLPQNTVSATALAAPGAPVGASAQAPAAPAAQDAQILLDPDEAYTQEVKDALISAMVVYGAPLSIGPDEWLTVAARDNAPVNPLIQSDADFRTIIFRIKGSDLIEFQTQRMTLDQVKARVSVQEF